ncbi:MAG: hypothetical protein J6R23_05455, partial [Spirochaetales bacterium]|nr:hypothetical protein [Spirochaetales bacterium]
LEKDKEDLKSLIYGVLETVEELDAKTVVITPYTRRFKKFPVKESLGLILSAINSYPIDESVRFIIALKDSNELKIAESLI